jgi:class 3 adenylate cyclase
MTSSETILDERLDRAVRAFLRQELQAPANAVTDFLDIMIEDARGSGLDGVLPDLQRMHGASVQLNAFVKSIVEKSGGEDKEPFESFHRRVRHDLRNPLNAIKGYSEMLIEEIPSEHPLLGDLEKLKQAADRLLAQIDSMVKLWRPDDAGPQPGAREQQVVSHVLRTVEAIDAAHPLKGLGEGADILVVDDNASNRDVLARRLAREGHRVTTAEDGPAALDLAVARRFDLILLDLIMPEMSGFDVLGRLKAAEATRDVPVIVISALDELDSVVRCIEAGAEDYLTKPFNPTLLSARVGASLERKRLHDKVVTQAADLAAWNRTLEQRVADQVSEIERVGRLKRFLSPQIADLVVSSGGERVLESHRRAITVVFCDLRGFTAFSELTEPEEVMTVLREYHKVLGQLIHKHEGTVERFTGDGIMVFFNDPVPCTDPSLRAARMAVEMRAQVTALLEKWRKLGHELGFGVGIAHGYATLGPIGFEDRLDYGAVGTVVNLAARLCAEARNGQILVDPKVHAAIETQADFEPAGELALKGIQRPVPTFNVVAAR